jgi:glycosyltransferase involved in cell wall biosynthesis
MINLNIITRCTRTTKLKEIFESFDFEQKKFKINWHLLFDIRVLSSLPTDLIVFLQDRAICKYMESDPKDFGHDMINKTIDNIEDGLIYILDDDNIIHPEFWILLDEWSNEFDNYDGLIYSQKIGGIDFTGQDVRTASSENVKVSKIDMAQFCLKKSLIGENRIPKGYYVGDGMFIEDLFKKESHRFKVIDHIGCYYNYFKQNLVKDYFLPRVLVIGTQSDDQLVSKKYLGYEDVRIKTKYIQNDLDINKVISDFKPNSIITVGEDWKKYSNMSSQSLTFRRSWLHMNEIDENSGETAFNCLSRSMLEPFYLDNPLISVFTPLFNTGETLWRTYESMKNQKYNNWEWVLTNDSTDEGKTLKIAKEIEKMDPRVKVYDFNPKSGGIVGESKYRAACMCSGMYLLEFDHDDYLLPSALGYVVEAFQKFPDCKFVYSDCAEIDQNHNSLTYGDGFAFGYGSYREEEWNGKTYKAVNTQNINPKTIRHIVGVPNHIRAWDRFFYHSIGGHNRNLSIADDYELVVRSFLKTKFVRIPKMLYLQFFHNSNTQNDSRADIQRRVRIISWHYNELIKQRFDELGVIDWAYLFNSNSPLMAPSRFGNEENAVNYIWRENETYFEYKTPEKFSIID